MGYIAAKLVDSILSAIWQMGAVAVGIGLVAGAIPVAESMEFSQQRDGRLRATQGAYEKIVTAHRQDQAMLDFQNRLKAIDEVTDLLLARIRSAQSASLEKLLEEQLRAPRAVRPIENTMTAAEIYMEYADEFERALPRPAVSGEEMKALLDHYAAVLAAAREAVVQRCRTMALTDARLLGQAAQLAAVLPLLQVPDGVWAARDIDALAAWMRAADAIEALETFALAVRRPITAYEFSAYRMPVSQRPARQDGLKSYLRTAADRLVEDREYHAGLHCLKIAIELAEQDRDAKAAADLRFRRADVLARVGHPGLAAEEIRQVLMGASSPDVYGRAAMLRLKYLYEAEQFAEIIQESSSYQVEEQSASHQPQIVYIRWLALRRLNQVEEARRVQGEFLERFPAHPLGADIHFAAAMTALAASDYPEALSLLELIQYRYPNSKVIPKVKEIQQRLQEVSQARTRQ